MKNLQKLICLLALIVGINSLSAQKDSFLFASQNIFGIDYLKIAFTDGTKFSLCNAKFSLKSSLDVENVFSPLKIKSCTETKNASGATLELIAADGQTYKVEYSTENNVAMSDGDGFKYIFGLRTILKANKDEFHIFSAGDNTYLSLSIAKFGFNAELFEFKTPAEAKNFDTAFQEIIFSSIEEADFTAIPVLSLENLPISGKIKTNSLGDIYLDITYKGETLSLFINSIK
jgi:hypothetical protein